MCFIIFLFSAVAVNCCVLWCLFRIVVLKGHKHAPFMILFIALVASNVVLGAYLAGSLPKSTYLNAELYIPLGCFFGSVLGNLISIVIVYSLPDRGQMSLREDIDRDRAVREIGKHFGDADPKSEDFTKEPPRDQEDRYKIE